MKNIFFELALGKAKQILGARARILLLLARLAAKLKNLNVKDIKSNEVKQRIFVFGRLRGRYAYLVVDGLVGVDLTDFDHLFFLVLEVLEASSSHL